MPHVHSRRRPRAKLANHYGSVMIPPCDSTSLISVEDVTELRNSESSMSRDVHSKEIRRVECCRVLLPRVGGRGAASAAAAVPTARSHANSLPVSSRPAADIDAFERGMVCSGVEKWPSTTVAICAREAVHIVRASSLNTAALWHVHRRTTGSCRETPHCNSRLRFRRDSRHPSVQWRASSYRLAGSADKPSGRHELHAGWLPAATTGVGAAGADGNVLGRGRLQGSGTKHASMRRRPNV
jgi:hypothetical protein